MDKYYLFMEGQIILTLYDHFFNSIIISSEDNSLFLQGIKGHNIMDDKDDEQKKQDTQQDEEEEDNNCIECDLIRYGPHYDLILSVTSHVEVHLIDI